MKSFTRLKRRIKDREHQRKALATLQGITQEYIATVLAFGKTNTDEPTVLLHQIRFANSHKLAARHVWIRLKDIINASSICLQEGHQISLSAKAYKYRTPISKFIAKKYSLNAIRINSFS